MCECHICHFNDKDTLVKVKVLEMTFELTNWYNYTSDNFNQQRWDAKLFFLFLLCWLCLSAANNDLKFLFSVDMRVSADTLLFTILMNFFCYLYLNGQFFRWIESSFQTKTFNGTCLKTKIVFYTWNGVYSEIFSTTNQY